MNHRSKALRDSARDEPCVACGSVGTTVWAHSNQQAHGKGMGMKSHDILGMYLCHLCHAIYDQKLNRQQQRLFFHEHYPKAMVRVAEKLESGELRL